MEQEKKDIKFIGKIKCQIHDQSTLSAEETLFNENLYNKYIDGIINRAEYFSKFIFGKLKFEELKTNVISVDGLNMVSKYLAGENPDPTGINYALFGDGVGVPSQNDTQLFNETFRNLQASRSSQDNQVLLTGFIDTAEFSGTIREFGNCLSGTATANTGKLWSHIAGLTWVKDSNSTLTVSQLYTLVNT